jgi:Tol biopolymer transport system component
MTNSTRHSRSRTLLGPRSSGLALLLVAVVTGCGSDVLDAGELGDSGSGGSSSEAGGSGGTAANVPDGEIPLGDDTSIATDLNAGPGSGPEPPCPIEGLSEYRLVFDADDGRLERRVYTMRADGGHIEVLTREGLLAQDAVVSPDGSTVAYSTSEGIEYLDWASGAASVVLPDAEQPSWSHDGAQLAFTSSPGVGIGPSGELSLAATYFTQRSYFPSFSADDTSLVYSLQSLNDVGQVYSLNRTNYTTFESREIVRSSPIRVATSSASPDGQWVAVALECNPNADQPVFSLWVAPYALSSTACEGRPLWSGNATNPAWGPGSLVAFELGTTSRDIAIVDAQSGEACVIQLPGDERNPSWVPDALVPPPR